MKKLVIYYSLEGHTKLIADIIAKQVGADTIALQPKKEYATKGFQKFLWGGKSVVFKEKPTLLNDFPDMSVYDTIYIGTPVWASTYAPPILSFMSEQKLQGKAIYLFACHGGGGATKCFKKFTKALSGNTIVKEIEFCDPKQEDSSLLEEHIKDFLLEE